MGKHNYTNTEIQLIRLGFEDVLKYMVPNGNRDPDIFINTLRQYPNKALNCTDCVDYLVHLYYNQSKAEFTLKSITAHFLRQGTGSDIYLEVDYLAEAGEFPDTQKIYQEFCDHLAGRLQNESSTAKESEKNKPLEETSRKRNNTRNIQPDNSSQKKRR